METSSLCYSSFNLTMLRRMGNLMKNLLRSSWIINWWQCLERRITCIKYIHRFREESTEQISDFILVVRIAMVMIQSESVDTVLTWILILDLLNSWACLRWRAVMHAISKLETRLEKNQQLGPNLWCALYIVALPLFGPTKCICENGQLRAPNYL